MLIFISFVVLFLSAYFWPRQDRNLALKIGESEVPARKRRPRKKKPPVEAAAQQPAAADQAAQNAAT